MTGNIALDVFIGLAFIYLLYSLYATVIVEIISSLLKLRANNLRTAIGKMFADEEHWPVRRWFGAFPYIWDRILLFFGKERDEGKRPVKRLIDHFYEQPTIKFLSKRGFFWMDKPSYIAPHSFSKALIDYLKSGEPGDNLLSKITSGLEKTALKGRVKDHIRSLLEDANNDLEKFRILVEQWYNDTMERSIGWFKRNNQFILLIVGFLLAFFFNLNTFHISRILSKDSKAREQLVELAAGKSAEYEARLNTLKESSEKTTVTVEELDSLLDIQKDLKADMKSTEILFGGGWNLPGRNVSCPGPSETSGKAKYDCMEASVRVGSFLMKKNHKTIRIIRPDKSYRLDMALYKKSIRLRRVKSRNHVGEKTTECKYQFVPLKYKWKYFWHNFWGYLLTAIAISLGSPFWFDLLNKLVKLRGSTRQPVSSESKASGENKSTAAADNPLNRKG